MRSEALGLLVGATLAIVATSGPVSAQQLDRSVSDDGLGLQASAAGGVSGTMVKAFAGTGIALPDADVAAESAAEVWALWALEPKTAPLGRESIIGADNRVLIRNTRQFPYRAMVLITFENSRCTGWMIGADTVATAGHCVHSGGSSGRWYQRSTYRIYPGRNGNASPYGSCTAKRLYSVNGWTRNGADDFDYGAIKLNCTVGNTVGWLGFFWQTATLTGLPTIISGYPGDKPLTQWRSTDKVRVTQQRRVFYRNDTVGGMSGSAVYYNRSGCGNCAMAIHAYGVYGSPPFSNNNHGTRITKAVYDNLVTWRNAP
jgi:glutamyl endopeptidase